MQPAAAVSFLHLLPKRYHNLKLYNLALQACAYGRDLTRALEILELLDALRVKKDAKLLTSMINVCASVGNAERAFKFFSDVKQEFPQQVDGKVYGSVVAACAEAMLREVSVVHERKDQYVLLERAFQVVLDAEKCSVPLEIPVYNSLLVCAGRSGQIGRAFEVLDMMLARGLRPDAITHGSLIEACVQAKRKDLALKIFHGALQRGFGDKVEIYTAAISACKIEGSVDLAKALEIHTLLDVSYCSYLEGLYRLHTLYVSTDLISNIDPPNLSDPLLLSLPSPPSSHYGTTACSSPARQEVLRRPCCSGWQGGAHGRGL